MQGTIEWVPAVNACVITGTSRFRWGITINFITDVILLTVMFAGVLNKRNSTGLCRVLYIQVCYHPFRLSDFRAACTQLSQGLSWILVASFVEILPAVCTLFVFGVYVQ